MSIWRTKTVEQSIRDTDEPGHRLRKDLNGFDLAVFGVGVIVGSGIFVVTGNQAAENAGPAVVLAFLMAGLVCALAGMCYAEFASVVPVAGSAYTFGYASIGEFAAWIIGWDLILEFTVAASVVSSGWSEYAASFLGVPLTFHVPVGFQLGGWPEDGQWPVNLGAIFIAVVLGVIASLGAKLSGRFSAVVVAIKVGVVLLIVAVGAFYVKASNWDPFIPGATPVPPEDTSTGQTPLTQFLLGMEPSQYGLWGVIAAASVVFFAYLGFDVLATTAEETRKPRRDVPVGIFGALLVVTILYMAVSAIVTGMRPYDKLGGEAPLAEAFHAVGAGWAGTVIALGAIIGMVTVPLILIMGQSRVVFAMSRDGLLPRGLSRTHPRFGTPYIMTGITTAAVALLSGFVPILALEEMVNIGTLFAFVVVSIGVIVLRVRRSDLPRGFRVPLVWVVAPVTALACVWLMINLTVDTWIRFVVWMVIGIAIYFFYGMRRSRAGHTAPAGPAEEASGSGTEH